MTNKINENKSKHGGARTGAGRKTRYEKTVVMRVPEKYRDAIKGLIDHLDACEMVDQNYKAEESENFFTRQTAENKL